MSIEDPCGWLYEQVELAAEAGLPQEKALEAAVIDVYADMEASS